MKTILIIGFFLCSQTLAYGSNDFIDTLRWQLKKDAGGVQIYSAKVSDSPYQAILAQTLVNASVEEVVSILRTPDTCQHWVYRCKDSYLFESLSQDTDLVYTATDMPFPTKDRDILAKITWHTDPSTNTVRAVGVATQTELAQQKEKVRIEGAHMIWELTPIGQGKTKISNYAHIDPAGYIPPWLVNQLSINAPLKTLQGLKKLILELNPIG